MSAWTVIQHTEVGSGGAANITFSSIPATYTDLLILVSPRGESANTSRYLRLDINSSGVSSVSYRWLNGTGSTVNSYSSTGDLVAVNAGNNTANTFSNVLIYIPNYAGNTNKSISIDAVMENNATYSEQTITAALWSNTAAITSIALALNGPDEFNQYSSATLYGILKGSSGGVTVS
jgi:hypothetical protein